MSRLQEYYQRIQDVERDIFAQESDTILRVSRLMAQTLKDGGRLFLFGCGHSHILVEEAFYRAGGLVPVHPVFDTAVMLHEGAVKSSAVEKSQSYGDWIFDRQDIAAGDMVFVFSNSGINGCPVEFASRSRQAGALVVSVTSRVYETRETTRHDSGLRLKDFSDYVLDTHVPYGDALVTCGKQQVAPGSTIASALIWNMLIAQLSQEAEEMGCPAEFFVSGNVTGGQETNLRHIHKYRKDISSL